MVPNDHMSEAEVIGSRLGDSCSGDMNVSSTASQANKEMKSKIYFSRVGQTFFWLVIFKARRWQITQLRFTFCGLKSRNLVSRWAQKKKEEKFGFTFFGRQLHHTQINGHQHFFYKESGKDAKWIVYCWV
jgi:hypothetical protein